MRCTLVFVVVLLVVLLAEPGLSKRRKGGKSMSWSGSKSRKPYGSKNRYAENNGWQQRGSRRNSYRGNNGQQRPSRTQKWLNTIDQIGDTVVKFIPPVQDTRTNVLPARRNWMTDEASAEGYLDPVFYLIE